MNHGSTDSYSVAIRTLGLNPALLRRELESVYAQSLPPARVVIYIAEGYEAPDFRVGDEIYVPTPKGMVRQRAVDYAEIETPLVMLLDDDVILSPKSAETLIDGLVLYNLDCISPDTFANHRMTWRGKVYAALSNLTLPHRDKRFAFKISRNGSFSYLGRPKADVYLSQTAAGPCSLWKTDVLRAMAFADETWLDAIGFAYNDDTLEFYKLYRNGGRLGIHYSVGVEHAGGKTSSGAYHRDPERYRMRAKAQYLVWHRSLMSWRRPGPGRALTAAAYWTKMALTLPAIVAAGLLGRNARVPLQHIKGTIDGVRHTKTAEYRNLPPYVK